MSRGRPRYGHACANTRPRHSFSSRGTTPMIRRWARSRRAGPAGAGAGELGARTQAEARGACGRDAAIRQLSLRHGQGLGHNTAEGPGHDTTRPARTWACLGVSWASFGARAPGLFFDLVFRLGIGSESPFGPGS